MKSAEFKVDNFDTVRACMLECMRIQGLLKQANINIDIVNHKNKYGQNYSYELIFKNEEDYTVYQLIK